MWPFATSMLRLALTQRRLNSCCARDHHGGNRSSSGRNVHIKGPAAGVPAIIVIVYSATATNLSQLRSLDVYRVDAIQPGLRTYMQAFLQLCVHDHQDTRSVHCRNAIEHGGPQHALPTRGDLPQPPQSCPSAVLPSVQSPQESWR